jgi:AmmeMemoRadiSam system protein B
MLATPSGAREPDAQSTATTSQGIDRPLIRSIDAIPVTIDGETMIELHDPQNLATGSVCVSPAALFLIQHFDGEHGIPELQKAIVEAGGQPVAADIIQDLIRKLDENLYLESPAFAAHHERLVAEFRSAPVRAPMHAGTSYPAEAAPLRQELEGHLSAAGPGPGAAAAGEAVRAMIVPHIDLQRGSACYGRGYRHLAGGPRPQRAVILGTCHGPMKRLFALTRKPFATPLGEARTDAAFVDRLAARAGDRYFDDEFAHRGEHSIEYQVLFLQHLFGPDLALVPILCGSLEWFVAKGRIPSETHEVQSFFGALREQLDGGPETGVVAAADLSHVGPRFGDSKPCSKAFLDLVRRHDLECLSFVEAGDPEGFYRSVALSGNRLRVCGLFPIYTVLSILDGLRGKVLSYEQAVDPAKTQCVTFASVAFPAR